MPHASFHDGLQVYRGDDLRQAYRDGKVADATDLKRRRLRPAEGQKPVGQYWTGYQWTRLYAVAEAVPMPALSPGRQRRWDMVRTCARCSATRRDPYELDHRTGRRVCVGCEPVDRAVHWHVVRNQDRALAVQLAQEVLASPAVAVWATADGPPADYYRWLVAAAAVAVDRRRLFAAEARVNEPLPRWATVPAGYEGRGVALADMTDSLRQLQAYRLMSWSWGFHGSLDSFACDELGIDLKVGREVLHQRPGPDGDPDGGVVVWDSVGDLATLWLGRERTDRSSWPHLYAFPAGPTDVIVAPAAHPDDVDLPEVAAACAAQARHLLAVLRTIATGEHPEGPARCPHRDGREGEPCRAIDLTPQGLCTGHSGGEAPSAKREHQGDIN